MARKRGAAGRVALLLRAAAATAAAAAGGLGGGGLGSCADEDAAPAPSPLPAPAELRALPAVWESARHALGREPLCAIGCLAVAADNPWCAAEDWLGSQFEAAAAASFPDSRSSAPPPGAAAPAPAPRRAAPRSRKAKPARCPSAAPTPAGERAVPPTVRPTKRATSATDDEGDTNALINIWGQEFIPAMREWIFFSPRARQWHRPRHQIFLVSGGNRAEYRDIVVPNHQGVAFRLGYNYSFAFGRAPPKGYSVYWNKVAVLLDELARSPDGCYCVWVDDDMVVLPSDALEAVIDDNAQASLIVSRDSWERAMVNTGTLIVRNDPLGRAALQEMLRVGKDRKHAHRGKLLAECTQADGCFSEQDALRAVILSRKLPSAAIAIVPQRLINTFARPQRHLSNGRLVRNNDAPSVIWGVGSPMGQCTGLEPGRVRETCIHTLLDVAAEVTRTADEKGAIIPYGSGPEALHEWWATGVPSRLRGRLRRPWERLFRGSADVARKVRDVPDAQAPAPRTVGSWWLPRQRTVRERAERCARMRRALRSLTELAPLDGHSEPSGSYPGVAPFGFALEPWGAGTLGLAWGDAQDCMFEEPHAGRPSGPSPWSWAFWATPDRQPASASPAAAAAGAAWGHRWWRGGRRGGAWPWQQPCADDALETDPELLVLRPARAAGRSGASAPSGQQAPPGTAERLRRLSQLFRNITRGWLPQRRAAPPSSANATRGLEPIELRRPLAATASTLLRA